MALQIEPSKLQGNLTLPPSKSHTLRAILFASLAEGISQIDHFLPSPDTTAMIEAVRLLGATVQIKEHSLFIRGFAGKPKAPSQEINCGNSGLVLRLIGALAALIPHKTILAGDASIRSSRPVKPLLNGLLQLGASATSLLHNDQAPIQIEGPFTKNSATIDGEDSQPVSGLLIAAAFAPHPTEIHVTNPGEKPWIDLTLHWLKKVGILYQMKDHTYYRLEGSSQIKAFYYSVPGDFSTAAFPIAAALLTHSKITIHNVDMDDIQGDKAIIPLLEKMGASFLIENKTLTVQKSDQLMGMKIDINHCIDALPILAVIGCFAKGTTEIVNGAIARKKESDRISCIVKELKKMGAHIEEKPDGLIVHTSQLQGTTLHSHHDHRLALSLSVAALAATNSSKIEQTECIAKTYPNFCKAFQTLGAKIYGL